MAENIHRGIDENGDPTHEVTDDHVDVPEKPAPDVERLAPIPESTVTVRGDDVGGHCNMTASEYREWSTKRRAKEEAEAKVEADAEAAANEVRMDAQLLNEQSETEKAEREAEERGRQAKASAEERQRQADEAAEAAEMTRLEEEERVRLEAEAGAAELAQAEVNSNILPEV